MEDDKDCWSVISGKKTEQRITSRRSLRQSKKAAAKNSISDNPAPGLVLNNSGKTAVPDSLPTGNQKQITSCSSPKKDRTVLLVPVQIDRDIKLVPVRQKATTPMVYSVKMKDETQMQPVCLSPSLNGDVLNKVVYVPENSADSLAAALLNKRKMKRSLEAKELLKKLKTEEKNQSNNSDSIDECLYCNCIHDKEEDCLYIFPKHQVCDSEPEPLLSVPCSIASLPTCLTLVNSPTGQKIVVSTENIPAWTQFGPVVGKHLEFYSLDCIPLEQIWIIEHPKNQDGYICTYSEAEDNWCRFLRLSVEQYECNLTAVYKDNSIYLISTKRIEQGNELIYCVPFMITLESQSFLDAYFTFKCPTCHQSLGDPENFLKHVRLYHRRGFHQVHCVCKYCDAQFDSFKDLCAHDKKEHGGYGAFTCHFCNRNYPGKSQLRKHFKLVHEESSAGTIACKVCKKEFCNSDRLKNHMYRVHTDLSLGCNFCEKTFKNRQSLNRHKLVHTDIYQYTCDRCGKMFREAANLKVHLLTHSKVKPFGCAETDCSAAFTTKQCLQQHYMKVHEYTRESMPEIMRKIPFTVEAYSGPD